MYFQNQAGQFVHFQGVDVSSGGIKSGVTWTVRRCIDGTFAGGGGTVTEDGTTGWYKYAMSQADTNGVNLGFNFTGSGAVPQTVNITTVTGIGGTVDASLVATGLDRVLVESGITAGASLTDDSGTQLTSINARQALALAIAADEGVLAGAATTAVTIKGAGLPSGNTRVSATVDSSGNRSALVLKVPT